MMGKGAIIKTPIDATAPMKRMSARSIIVLHFEFYVNT
jgi:hypothetical protein